VEPISRIETQHLTTTINEAIAGDRHYFDTHPDESEYIRDFAPGEFGAQELPEIPPGFTYATHVSVALRLDGAPVGRIRRLHGHLRRNRPRRCLIAAADRNELGTAKEETARTSS
jgi:hypothetical protein